MILALDPSSTCTGYALLESADELVECGRLRPRRDRDPPLDRIATMVGELRTMHEQTGGTDAVVIEIPDTKMAGRLGRASGLATYGMAVGAIWREAVLLWGAGHVHAVQPAQWTGSRRKAHRPAAVAVRFPQYDPDQDPGLDVADAIGLGVWWMERQQLRVEAG